MKIVKKKLSSKVGVTHNQSIIYQPITTQLNANAWLQQLSKLL